MKTKIFIACHKPCEVLHDDVYTPIHVGREKSKFKDEMAWMVGDMEGANISSKNPYYCEMTALYWAWKNVHDVDYIGFCHYRRFFKEKITNENIVDFLHNADVVFCDPYFSFSNTRLEGLKNYLIIEDIYIMFRVVEKLYPDYLPELVQYSNGHYNYMGNMLMCKKSLFDDYCGWIFSILEECEKSIKMGPYTRQQRVFGYIAEFLMPVYFMHNHYRIKTMPFIFNGDNVHRLSSKDKIKNKLLNILFKKKEFAKPYFDPSICAGLKSDGINI